MFYGPNLFTLKEKIGKTARVAANGHTNCFLQYWENLDKGMPEEEASAELEREIKANSEAWLHVSAKEFFDLLPANFGDERARAINVNSADIYNENKAGQPKRANFGLTSILGQAGRDFYVPDREVELTQSPDVVVERVKLPPKK